MAAAGALAPPPPPLLATASGLLRRGPLAKDSSSASSSSASASPSDSSSSSAPTAAEVAQAAWEGRTFELTRTALRYERKRRKTTASALGLSRHMGSGGSGAGGGGNAVTAASAAAGVGAMKVRSMALKGGAVYCVPSTTTTAATAAATTASPEAAGSASTSSSSRRTSPVRGRRRSLGQQASGEENWPDGAMYCFPFVVEGVLCNASPPPQSQRQQPRPQPQPQQAPQELNRWLLAASTEEDRSAWVDAIQVVIDSLAGSSEQSFAEDARLLALAQCMATDLALQDRMHRLYTYHRCFVGIEAVAWLKRHERCDDGQALLLGNAMLNRGLIFHVAHEHRLEPSRFFYRFSTAVDPHMQDRVSLLFNPIAASSRLLGGRGGSGKSRGDATSRQEQQPQLPLPPQATPCAAVPETYRPDARPGANVDSDLDPDSTGIPGLDEGDLHAQVMQSSTVRRRVRSRHTINGSTSAMRRRSSHATDQFAPKILRELSSLAQQVGDMRRSQMEMTGQLANAWSMQLSLMAAIVALLLAPHIPVHDTGSYGSTKSAILMAAGAFVLTWMTTWWCTPQRAPQQQLQRAWRHHTSTSRHCRTPHQRPLSKLMRHPSGLSTETDDGNHGGGDGVGNVDASESSNSTSSDDEREGSVDSDRSLVALLRENLPPVEQWPDRPLLVRISPMSIPSEIASTLADRAELSRPIKLHLRESINGVGALDGGQAPPLATVPFETTAFKGHVVFRVLGLPDTPDEYFQGRRRTMQAAVQGQFKRPVPFSVAYTGQQFERPLTKLPARWLLRSAFAVIRRLAPAFAEDVTGAKPYLISPLAATAQALHVTPAEGGAGVATPPDVREDVVENTVALGGVFADTKGKDVAMPATARKRYFSKPQNLEHHVFEPGLTYTFEFFQHLYNPVTFDIDLGFRKVPLAPWMNGHPMQIMAKCTDTDEWIWNFEVWHESLLSSNT